MKKPLALITCPIDTKQIDTLNNQVDIRDCPTKNRRISLAEQIPQQLLDAQIIVAETDLVDEATLAAAPNLELVISCRASPVNIDLEACRKRGIPVCTTPGRNADATADLTFALILDTVRRVTEASHWMRKGHWTPNDTGEPYRRFKGPTLSGKTLGVVGGGAVGRRVAQRALGFGMTVIVYDPFLTNNDLPDAMNLVSLDYLLENSDIVTLHVPLVEETISLIDDQRLAQMRQDSYLINASRAAVVVQPALVRSLESRHLAGAGLDVFAEEPPPAEEPLVTLPNVVVTPHIAGASDDVVNAQTAMVVEIINAQIGKTELPYRAREDLVDFRKVSPDAKS
jgi:D-3-phosphoglycerate dehydrogenase